MLIRDPRGPRLAGLPISVSEVWGGSRVPPGWIPADVGDSGIRWIRTSLDTGPEFFTRWLARHRAAHPSPREFETKLGDLERGVAHLPEVEPAGLICHLTRCGSTLVSNALATLENVRVFNEVDWFDRKMLAAKSPSRYISLDAVRALRDLTKVLAYCFGPETSSLVIKCAAAGNAGLKGAKVLWPDIRWVMIVRHPTEILVSLLDRFPKAFLDWYVGATECPYGTVPPEVLCNGIPDFLAWAVGRMCEEALSQTDSNCMIVDYGDLSPACVSGIATHLNLSDRCRRDSTFQDVFRVHAKRPEEIFMDDTLSKRERASDEIKNAVDRWAMPQYTSLLGSARRHTARSHEKPVCRLNQL